MCSMLPYGTSGIISVSDLVMIFFSVLMVCFLQAGIENQTGKGRRYQHVVALCGTFKIKHPFQIL